jgi:hypothetical protein
MKRDDEHSDLRGVLTHSSSSGGGGTEALQLLLGLFVSKKMGSGMS